jgi:LPS O-antigen subunit length determinant protein (WzzB/FepE family)
MIQSLIIGAVAGAIVVLLRNFKKKKEESDKDLLDND